MTSQPAWSVGDVAQGQRVSRDASLHERTVQAVAVGDLDTSWSRRREHRSRTSFVDVSRAEPEVVAEVQAQLARITGRRGRVTWTRSAEGQPVRAVIR